MAIMIRVNVILARRNLKTRKLEQEIGITEQNLSLLKSAKDKGVRFETLEKPTRRWTAKLLG